MAITDAVVPVAGLGTRLLPATRSQPKEMLPVVDKPVVQYVVEELVRAGIARLLFVTGRRKRAIEDHFDADPELDVEPLIDPRTGLQIFYTRQARPAGLGDAVRYGQAFASGDGTVVALGDAIIDTPPAAAPGIVPRLIEAYERHRPAARSRSPRSPMRPSHATESRSARRARAATRSSSRRSWRSRTPPTVPSRTAIMGRYVIGPAVFEALRETRPDRSGEVQLTSALQRVLESGGRLIAVPLGDGERRHDVGSVESYCATFLEHALVHPRLRPRTAGEGRCAHR